MDGTQLGMWLVKAASGALPLYDVDSPYMESCIAVGELLGS